jgi:glycosyltransferase involved in cell wall biosynthesis
MNAEGAPGVLAVVPHRWSDIVRPAHQVLRRLGRAFPVVWLEPPRAWRDYLDPAAGHFLERDLWSTPAPGLTVLAPGFTHPRLHRPLWLDALLFRSRLAAARRRLRAMGARRVALYLWRDTFAPALDLVRHDFSCYHVDDEYSFSDVDGPTPPRELEVLRRVDQVIVHSPALAAKKGGVNARTAQIPNGVDYAAFARDHAMPPDLAAIPAPRIGYAGVVKRQLDLALLARLARARPRASFVLVGPVMNMAGKEADIAALRAPPNVHWLGEKAVDALPAYVRNFDVCLMCYEVNGYTRYIYPMKLNEYLAAGRPTISSPIATMEGLGSVIALAQSDAEWLDALDRSLEPAAQDAAAVASRRAFARTHDWDRLADRIGDLFRAGLAHRRNS